MRRDYCELQKFLIFSAVHKLGFTVLEKHPFEEEATTQRYHLSGNHKLHQEGSGTKLEPTQKIWEGFIKNSGKEL